MTKNILRNFWDLLLASKILSSKHQQRVGNLTALHTVFQKACPVSKHMLKCSWSTVWCYMFQN